MKKTSYSFVIPLRNHKGVTKINWGLISAVEVYLRKFIWNSLLQNDYRGSDWKDVDAKVDPFQVYREKVSGEKLIITNKGVGTFDSPFGFSNVKSEEGLNFMQKLHEEHLNWSVRGKTRQRLVEVF